MAGRHGAGPGRPDLAGRDAGGGLAAADPGRAGGPARRARAGPRWPGPSWSSSCTDTYEQAAAKGYRDLVPANLYNVDYSILGTARIEPLLRRIRLDMAGAGLYVESAKGECNLGQHEIAFRYADAMTTCDNHSIYKTGARRSRHRRA